VDVPVNLDRAFREPVVEPFDLSDWIFETKLDGYRAVAMIDSNRKAQLWSRNRLPLERSSRWSWMQ
jgi:ATP-dependent DNA ligase